MKKSRLRQVLLSSTSIIAILAAMPSLAAPNLEPRTNNARAHIAPTVQGAKELAATRKAGLPLVYNGGPVMRHLSIYAIFRNPLSLQTGAPTNLPQFYQNVQMNLLTNYPGTGLGATTMQYYQNVGGVVTYPLNIPGVNGLSGLTGSYVDTSPYPASGCSDTTTPGNCITDAQIQAEIARNMAINGWTPGPNKMFLYYTSSGEGSCLGNSSSSCAYVPPFGYCGYHSLAGSPGNFTFYAVIPYQDQAACDAHGQPSPNGDRPSDVAANFTSHEVAEMITDPTLRAWKAADGGEIGDECSYVFGPNTWDGGLANQMFAGTFFELQELWSNHANACVQLGP